MKTILANLFIVSVSLAVSHGEWSGQVTTDRMTDEQIITMSTFNSADLLDAFFFGSSIPEFFVAFNEGDDSPLIGVHFNKYIGLGNSQSTCLIRIDDNPAEEYPVVIDPSGQMIGIAIGTDREVKEFFAELLRGNEFLIRFSPAGQGQVTTSFSLSGITAVSRELGIDVDYYLNLSSTGHSLETVYQTPPRVTRPSSNDVWVPGRSQEIAWTGMQGPEVSIVLKYENGTMDYLGNFPNSGSTLVRIDENIPDSDSYYIEIEDSSESAYPSRPFTIAHAVLNSPYPPGALPRILNRRISWEASGDQVRLSFWKEDRELFELSNGWINAGLSSLGTDICLPDSLPRSSQYRFVLQVRGSDATEYTYFSRNYTLAASDNTVNGAVSLNLNGDNTGSISYRGDDDYWQLSANRNREYAIRIEGQGDYSLKLVTYGGEILEQTTGNEIDFKSSTGENLYLLVQDEDSAPSGSYRLTVASESYTPPEPHRSWGGCVGGDYLKVDSLGYAGFHGGVLFSPIEYLELSVGGHSLSADDLSFTYVNGRALLASPRLSLFRILGGVSYDLQVSKPADYWYEEEFVSDSPALDTGLRSLISLDILLSSNPQGWSTSARFSSFFSADSLHRISAEICFYPKP